MEFKDGKVTISIEEFDALRDAENKWKEYWEDYYEEKIAVVVKEGNDLKARERELECAKRDNLVFTTLRYMGPNREGVFVDREEWIPESKKYQELKHAIVLDLSNYYRDLPLREKRKFLRSGDLKNYTKRLH